MSSNVPSIRLIVPTPDVSAATDFNTSVSSRASAKTKSVLGMFASGSVSSGQTPYNTMRSAGDFSDIVRRVGGEGSLTGRGWEVHVDAGDATVRRESAEGEGMVLIKKKAKTRGRIDGVFADATNTRSESPQPVEGTSKDKWWTLSRGRKETAGKDGGVLGLMRRGKSPGPSLPPTPPLDVAQRPQRSLQTQTQDPDCTLDMVDVPSLRGRAVAKDLPPQQFPAQKRFNSLGASSALAPAPQPRAEFQRSVSAGSAALLAQSQQAHPHPQYAHMAGASTPYATMTRLDTYTQPSNPKSSPPKPPQPQRSASALGVYSSNAPPEFKRSLSALAGSGIVLGAPASTLGRAPTPTPLSRAPTPVPGPRSGTPQPATVNSGLLSVPGGKDNQGSIALRAMRSVRSMARLGGRGDEREIPDAETMPNLGTGTGTIKAKKKTKEEEREEKEKRRKEKEEEKERKKKEKAKKEGKEKRVPKSSGSSFEIGTLGASPVQRKRSILGLGLGGKGSTTGIGMGLPSALTLGRSGGKASTASSIGASATGYVAHANPTNPIINPNRLSADAPGQPRRESTNSSLRPVSVLSSGSSTGSRVSSGSSVRWAEEVVDRMRSRSASAKTDKEKRDSTSKHSVEGRKRTPLSDVFPSLSRRSSAAESKRSSGNSMAPPMLTLEEATTDGHGHEDEDEEDVEMEDLERENDVQIMSAASAQAAPATVTTTPVKRRVRPRPISDDMIDDGRPRARPRGIIEDPSAPGGVLNLLDAATNDLESLLTHLELDSTPSPARGVFVPPSADNSPIGKKTLRASEGSVSSLRPYAARNLAAKSSRPLLGQQIAPWPNSPQSSPPARATPPASATFKRAHRRTMTPTPEPEPAPVLQPLRLRPSRIRPAVVMASPSPPPTSSGSEDGTDMRAPSSLTFGSRSSTGSTDVRQLPPVFTRHTRNRSSLLPDAPVSPKSSTESRNGMPLARDAKRVLGMAGTLGGSQASDYQEEELDASDPDSDIPNELQVILSSCATSPADDTMSFFPDQVGNASLPSPGLPPADLPPSLPPPQLELPRFNLELAEDDGNHADIDSEEDTKKSFDFTGELQKLNESGASDRRSFVEQLENAFKTPAKIDLRNLLSIDVPPVPPMPFVLEQAEADVSGSSGSSLHLPRNEEGSALDRASTAAILDYEYPTQIIEFKEPTLLPGSDSLGSEHSLLPPQPPSAGRSPGVLNVQFKFGAPPPEEEDPPRREALTLSNILPPPSHVRAQSMASLMEEDESVLKSIFAHAAEIELPSPQRRERPRVNSGSSLRRSAMENSRLSMASMHSRSRSRPQSGISFTGFDSFDEVRRGFEFHQNRPTFYPAPVAARNTSARGGRHAPQDSVFSIASVSSYGHVTNPGVSDPFEYGLPPMPSVREQPSSEDLSVSMSLNVDDTFSFLGRDPHRHHQRIGSDASSFYFKAPNQTSFARGHRTRDSIMSVSSQGGPPNSFYNYNRSFAHGRLDEADEDTSRSSGSGSSLAHQYAKEGANGGRAAWARHQQNSSMDSELSDYSFARLGRPGVGDKMFDTAYDRGSRLSAISGSPAESEFHNASSYDSIIDGDEQRRSLEDSLFDKTGRRSSMSSDSVFGYDDQHPQNGHLLPPNQFRPLSMLSVDMSTSQHSPRRDDDTMITMLGGGHVRRRSIGSVFEASPCVRVEKRKHATFQEDDGGAHKARVINAQPSIASTHSSKFGDERMIRAQQGLLVRQSLEESALMADGEVAMALRQAPVFSRPSPNRSRSSTITTSSSGAETPPLSAADYSSMSDGSQSSIDMSEVSFRLVNTTHPAPNTARMRTRARGQGHRRRMSAAQSRSSRTASVYETIQEEFSSPAPSSRSSKKNSSSPTACQGIFVVDADSGSLDLTPGSSMRWDDERGISALRKYYALRNEAEDALTESKRTWLDTPFSLFALQSFQPPQHPEAMQALLQHSVESYGPLPYELGHRRVRSRTSSRPSPYPIRQAPSSPHVITSNSPRPSPEELNKVFMSPALQTVEFDPNVEANSFSLSALLSPQQNDAKNIKSWGLPPTTRPRVPSAARRSALGWAKRSTKASSDLKENNLNASGMSFVMSPNDSLRINRPRPKARPGAPTPRRALQAQLA